MSFRILGNTLMHRNYSTKITYYAKKKIFASAFAAAQRITFPSCFSSLCEAGNRHFLIFFCTTTCFKGERIMPFRPATAFGLAILMAHGAAAADPEQVDRLLATGACPGCDLGGWVLPGAALAGASLPGAYLTGALLPGADLTNADLSGVEMRIGSLRGADLSGARLRSAMLVGVDISEARLVGADLAGANLGPYPLHPFEEPLNGLEEALLHWYATSTDLTRSDLSGGEPRSGRPHRCPAAGSDVVRDRPEAGHACRCAPDGGGPAGARLDGADLRNADMTDADLTDADLTGVDLEPAVLCRTLTSEGLRNDDCRHAR
jgi:uncharacterized protein YjbI with pentapeptide repeats